MAKAAPNRGEIFWADLRPGKGSEQNGFRPVLIISNNLMNETNSVVLAIPMTTSTEKVKAGPFNIAYKSSDYTSISTVIAKLKELGHSFVHDDGLVLCNQARAISKVRIFEKVGAFINPQILINIKSSIIDSFALDACEGCSYPVRPGGHRCGKCGRIHKKKCRKCSQVFDLLFNFCPHCGEGV